MITDSGYSEGGASNRKKTLKSWNPISLSSKSDINYNLSKLRNRSRDLVMNSPIGSAVIETCAIYTIGRGLKLFPRINAEILGMTQEEAREWNHRTASEFELWAMNPETDWNKRNNFYDLQWIAFESYLIDGDSFLLFRRQRPSIRNPYTLRLQLLEGNRVCNPYESIYTSGNVSYADNGNRIIDGVELDSNGRQIAYWIASSVPGDYVDSALPRWTRVKAIGDLTGFRNILQISHDIRADQLRGVPILAPVIETLKQISRYTSAELDSAVVRSYYSVFFTQMLDGSQMDLNSLRSEGAEPLDVSEMKLGSGTIAALPAGVDVKSLDSSRQSAFPSFVTELIKQIGASLSIPFEVLMHSFNSSYSASRAALLQAWDHFSARRAWFVRDFLRPVYETWLNEAILQGRIIAPGFFDDPLTRAAYESADWYGSRMLLLDPKKELEATKMKIEMGLSTRQHETAELMGTDFEKNVEQLRYENSLFE
ncbi:MAG: phage portal protein [Selenomonadaceae bacterium]|nr:phage portal protein [Selenomonadaceae bacterium]